MSQKGTYNSKFLKAAKVVIVIFIIGMTIASLQIVGIITFLGPVSATIGFTILLDTIIICCVASSSIGTISQNLDRYEAEERLFKEGKELYDLGEWEEALVFFSKLLNPDMDHKRALYYSARCYEELGQWEEVKKFCVKYLELVPKDREVWELLARAHKRLFEYEEAEQAMQQASKLKKQ